MDAPYEPTAADLDDRDTDSLPTIRAARNPNPEVLTSLLRLAGPTANPRQRLAYSANAYVPGYVGLGVEIPLTAAIEAGLPRNVGILLAHGADPDGYPLTEYLKYAQLVLRPKGVSTPADSKRDVRSLLKQPLDAAAVEARSQTDMPFWCSADSVPLDVHRGGNGMTPVEVACKQASPKILEMVLAAGPDVSFWTLASPSGDELLDFTRPSTLSVSNPLLCAIAHHHPHHIRSLLERGFNPNATPVVSRHQSYTPLLAALSSTPPDWASFTTLLSHPRTDPNLSTPITKAHLLHIATAHLSLPTLQRVLTATSISLPNVPATAARLTLLHVACLPLDITHVNIFQESVYASFHECRTLALVGPSPKILVHDGFPEEQPTSFFPAQNDLVLYLLSHCAADADPATLLSQQDCHGNTPLHYLAMHRTINDDLMDALMDASTEVYGVYCDVRNKWGWSAENLVRHGEVAVFEEEKPFWKHDHLKWPRS